MPSEDCNHTSIASTSITAITTTINRLATFLLKLPNFVSCTGFSQMWSFGNCQSRTFYKTDALLSPIVSKYWRITLAHGEMNQNKTLDRVASKKNNSGDEVTKTKSNWQNVRERRTRWLCRMLAKKTKLSAATARRGLSPSHEHAVSMPGTDRLLTCCIYNHNISTVSQSINPSN